MVCTAKKAGTPPHYVNIDQKKEIRDFHTCVTVAPQFLLQNTTFFALNGTSCQVVQTMHQI